MESLSNVYGLNKSIDKLRGEMIQLMYNESQRSLDLDTVVLIKMGKLQTEYVDLAHERNEKLKYAYSYKIVTSRAASNSIDLINQLLTLPKLKIATMVIGKNSTTLDMTPKWFQPDDQSKALKNIKYPPNITEKRPFDTVARFRAVKNETNDFSRKSIEVKEDSIETLVLALDAFAQQFGGQLSFTSDNLSFEESAHQTACGVANLGSAHLLATGHVPSAKFVLIIDIDYDDLAKSEETMQTFLLGFADAVAQDLSCDNDYVRVSSVKKAAKGKGKAEVNLVLTTPDKSKTEELADTLKDHARSGFSDKTILRHIIPDEYQCEWKPILSYLQLKPTDFDRRFNFDYRQENLPETQMRGGLPYYLPMKWYRHALKVDDKYKGDSFWLGSSNVPGEWPVAFHGTQSKAVKGITDEGLLVSAVKVDLRKDEAIAQKGEEVNRPGLYVATHCNGGSHPTYTAQFEVKISPNKSETFQVVFQCRVRPGSYTTHKGPVKVGEAWRIVDPTAVRPYGILLKNIELKAPYEDD